MVYFASSSTYATTQSQVVQVRDPISVLAVTLGQWQRGTPIPL